jgi:hypothetical protein
MPQTLMKKPISAPSLALLGSFTLAVVLSQIRTCTPYRGCSKPFAWVLRGEDVTERVYRTGNAGNSGVEEDREPPGGEGGKATGRPP